MPRFSFQKNRRYLVTYLPAGARSKTQTFEANYLGVNQMYVAAHDFDLRPKAGTATIQEDQIREVKDIGKAVWDRS